MLTKNVPKAPIIKALNLEKLVYLSPCNPIKAVITKNSNVCQPIQFQTISVKNGWLLPKTTYSFVTATSKPKVAKTTATIRTSKGTMYSRIKEYPLKLITSLVNKSLKVAKNGMKIRIKTRMRNKVTNVSCETLIL